MKRTILAIYMGITGLSAEVIPLYIGTGGTDGIYQSTLNTETGALSEAKLVAKLNKPSALAIGPHKKFLYAAGSHKDKGVKKSWNTAHAFRIEKDYSLTSVGINDTGSSGACYVFAHPDGKKLFVAHYATADVSSMKVSEKGIISPAVSVVRNVGSSVHKSRQKKAFGHSVYTSPDGKFVYSADLGTDEVIVYDLDADTAEIKKISSVKVPAGSGPRHMAFNKDGSILYVLNELTLTISKLQRNIETGELKVMDTKPTTQEKKLEGFTCSEIHLTKDQKFLYAAIRDLKNTGKDRIALLNPETLEIVQEHLVGAWVPRHFNISPSGKWLVVAGQKGNKVVVHKRDPETGKLSHANQSIDVGLPMWILFPQ